MELLGNGVLLSINYERILVNKLSDLGVRVGFGYYPIDIRHFYSLPFEVVVIFGDKKHYLELGAGISYCSIISKKQDGFGTYSIMVFPRIGYRYTGNKGLLIRAGYTPVLELPELDLFDKPFQSFRGISISYSL